MHNHDMNWLELVHSDREYSVNFGKHVIWVGFQMLKIWRQSTKHVVDLFLVHSLHDESFVLSEEEKVTTGASSFSCICDLLNNFGWVKRL